MAGFKKETTSARLKEKVLLNSASVPSTLTHKLAGFIGAGFLHLVGKTSFVYGLDHPDTLAYRREKKPVIYAFWHNAQVFLAYAHRGEGVNIMVSKSKDGEYIAQVMKRLGLNAVRGSTSKGAEQGLRQMCDLLKNGNQVGFTPDGPRGPVQTVHGGVVLSAQLAGVPVIPVATATTRKIVFRSWDKFVLPLPFAVTVVAHGKPLIIGKDISLEQGKENVRLALNAVVEAAEERLKTLPSWGGSLVGVLFSIGYTFCVTLALPFSLPVLMAKFGAKRALLFLKERVTSPTIATNGRPTVWCHAASIGEWQALKPILERMDAAQINCVVTVSAPEARVLVARDKSDVIVRMAPIDWPPVVKRWVGTLNATVVMIVETELWPNLLSAVRKSRTPLVLVNGRLSKQSLRRWSVARPFARRILDCFSLAFMRTDLDGRRFVELGLPYDRVNVAGNTKYDNLNATLPTPDHLRSRFLKRHRMFNDVSGVLIVAASTWYGEEEAMLRLFEKKSQTRLRLILAPRRMNRVSEVSKLFEKTSVSWSLWSNVKKSRQWDTDILLVDTLGDLKELIAVSDIGFVGGSLFLNGGQNPLEPAAAGVPVLFGVSMENFHEEAAELKRCGGARQARHETDLLLDIHELANDESARITMGMAAARFVASRQGASQRIANELMRMVSA